MARAGWLSMPGVLGRRIWPMVPERSCLVWLPEPGGGYGAPPELAWRYSRPSSASVSCSVLISRSTSSGGISTQVVVTGRPADVLAVCLRPMSVLPPTMRVRTLVNWRMGAVVMAPWWHEKARSGRACFSVYFSISHRGHVLQDGMHDILLAF